MHNKITTIEEKMGWTKLEDGGYNNNYWYASPESPKEINKDFEPDEYSAVPYVPENDRYYFIGNVPKGTKSIIFDMQHEKEGLEWDCGFTFKDLKAVGRKMRTFRSFEDAFQEDFSDLIDED